MTDQTRNSVTRQAIIKLAVILAVLFLAVSAISYVYLSHLLKGKTVEQLDKYIAERGRGESHLFQLAEDSQRALRDEYVYQWGRLGRRDPKQRFEELYRPYGDGTLRLDQAYYDGHLQNNSLYTRHITGFIGGDVPITPELRRKMVLLYELMNVYGTAWTVWDNRFINLWFVTPDGMLVEGMPGTPYALNVPAEMEFEKEEWAWFADAEHNPGRDSVWTTFYFDPTSKKWLVSCATPVYVGDEHAFTIGQDILLDEFLDRAVRVHLPGARNVVFRADGKLIADEGKTNDILKMGGDYGISDSGDLELKRIYERVTDRAAAEVVINEPEFGNYLAVTTISGPDWNFVTVYPKRLLVNETRQAALVVVPLGFAALAIALAVLFRVLDRQVARPLNAFVGVTQRIGGGEFRAVEEPEFERLAKRPDEIGKLSRAFRSMTEELSASRHTLQSAHDNLEKRVEERTRELAREVLERRLAAEALRLARDEADAANRAKSDFLANMSHEIRTPMNGIIGFTTLTAKTSLDERQRGYVEKIRTSAQALLSLINDILDFSKIEAGKLDIETTRFQLQEVLEDIADLFADQAARKDIELIVHRGQGVPSALIGDPLRLRQILVNLTSNALKFTEHGEILVNVDALETSEQEVRLRFEVRDTGIGIEPKALERLFSAFTQADTSTTRKYGGTGLGLSICQQLVRLMGGRIGVESERSVGSTFWLEIPFRRQEGREEPVYHVAVDLRGLSTLVVDDNDTCRSVLEEMLKSFGFAVASEASGEGALQALETQWAKGSPVQLVLLDWRLAGIDGLETARRIREDDRFSGLRIVMVTAFGREKEKELGDQIGINGFLTKPIQQSLLYDTLMMVFGEQGIGVRTGLVTEDMVRVDCLAEARLLLVEDNPINQEVALNILTDAGARVDVANNGLEAVEAVREQVYDAVLMDMQMPEMDGYEATGVIRQSVRLDELPIIAMTAHAMEGDRQKCLDAGMNDYVSKPIDPDHLFATLRRWIKPGRGPDRAKAPQEVTVQPELAAPSQAGRADEQQDEVVGDLPGFDRTAALKRLGGNEALYTRLLTRLVQENRETGRRVREDMDKGDWEAAHHRIHSLKGVAGNLSVETLLAVTVRLEGLVKRRLAAQETDASELASAQDAFEHTLSDTLTLLAGHLGLPDVVEIAASGTGAQPPESLEEIPEAFAERIVEAVEDGDLMALEGLAGELPPGSSLAAELSKLAEDFDFDGLQALALRLRPKNSDAD